MSSPMICLIGPKTRGRRCAAAQAGESISGAQAARSVCPSFSMTLASICLRCGEASTSASRCNAATSSFEKKVAKDQETVLVIFLELHVGELHRFVSLGEGRRTAFPHLPTAAIQIHDAINISGDMSFPSYTETSYEQFQDGAGMFIPPDRQPAVDLAAGM